MSYRYEYPRPALTVDAVVFAFDQTDLKVLLIQRKIAPFIGQWALPGGFVRMEESLDEAARRELQEEAGLENVFLEQLYSFGAPHRDPRGRTVSVAYYALVKREDFCPSASGDASDAAWYPLARVPKLAFDHDEILETAYRRLQAKVQYQPIGFELLPRNFTLSQLQHLYETILQRPLDKRNFRKKLLATGLLLDSGEMEENVAHRAAKLYRFDGVKYRELEKQGFHFEI